MNHQDLKILLSVYYDGEATPAEKDIIENHLVSCQECQKEYLEFQKISSSLKRWPQERLSADVQLNIKTINGKIGEKKMEEHTSDIQWGSIAVVFTMMVVAFVGMRHYGQVQSQARIREASKYLSAQTKQFDHETQRLALGHSTPRESSAVRNHTEITLAKVQDQPSESSVIAEKSKAQYEPYYLSSDYSADKNQDEKIFLGKSDRDKGSAEGFQRSTYLLPEKAINETRPAISGELTANVVSPASAPVRRQFLAQGLKYEVVAKEQGVQEGATYLWDDEFKQEYYPPPHSLSNTETYDHVIENSFLNPTDTPLSTFSIDVDTASYANMRRFLNNGQLPPVESIRIEEMINYFSYEYPEPAWGQPFSVTTEVGVCPWNPSHQLALIGLQGKRLNQSAMPSSNLVFLIDVSGSMNDPSKLPLLQNAFRAMVEELDSNDKVSIVVYAGAAGVVLEAASGNQKDYIFDAINRLRAGGSTAGGAGIQLAYQLAQSNFIPNGNNRVILATDGDFNVGVSSDEALTQMIEGYRNQGVFLTVLGFGTGNLKDSKMEKLADRGNGNYFYIDNINEGRKVLVQELGSTLFTIAKDVKLQVEFNPATVAAYRLIGYENRKLAKEDFNNDSKDAGELGAGHSVTALYEIIPAYEDSSLATRVDPLVYQRNAKKIPNFFESSDVMTVKLRYKEPQGLTSKLIKKSVGENDVRLGQYSDNLRLASAVAEFGLLLRNSMHRSSASFDHVIQQIRMAKPDRFGYRSELLDLVQKAKLLSPQAVPVPIMYDQGNVDRYSPDDERREKNQK